jgi:hypothetical protein
MAGKPAWAWELQDIPGVDVAAIDKVLDLT